MGESWVGSVGTAIAGYRGGKAVARSMVWTQSWWTLQGEESVLMNPALRAERDRSHLKVNVRSPPLLAASSEPRVRYWFFFCLFAFNFGFRSVLDGGSCLNLWVH